MSIRPRQIKASRQVPIPLRQDGCPQTPIPIKPPQPGLKLDIRETKVSPVKEQNSMG